MNPLYHNPHLFARHYTRTAVAERDSSDVGRGRTPVLVAVERYSQGFQALPLGVVSLEYGRRGLELAALRVAQHPESRPRRVRVTYGISPLKTPASILASPAGHCQSGRC